MCLKRSWKISAESQLHVPLKDVHPEPILKRYSFLPPNGGSYLPKIECRSADTDAVATYVDVLLLVPRLHHELVHLTCIGCSRTVQDLSYTNLLDGVGPWVI